KNPLVSNSNVASGGSEIRPYLCGPVLGDPGLVMVWPNSGRGGPVADWPYSDLVVVFPAGAGRGAGEEGGGFGVVGEAFCHGVEVEAAAEALGDDAEQENLGERAGDVEGRLRLLAALAGEDEVFDVVRETGRHPRQLRRQLTHVLLRDDPDR